MRTYKTLSARSTRAIGVALAQEVKSLQRTRRKRRTAIVIGLKGDLGAGKTTCIQGFIRAFRVRQRVISPTFLMVRRYGRIYHVDAYRITHVKELAPLGFKAILSDPKNIILIEWADRIRRALPKSTIWIRCEHGAHARERIILYEHPSSH